MLKLVPELNDAIVRRNAREIVADKIVSLIAVGVLQYGDVLPSERDLAAALHVSRATIRGAMQTLAARGIIEIAHGVRTRITKSDVELDLNHSRSAMAMNRYNLDDIHAARLLVERTVVAQSALNIDEATLGILEDLLASQAQSFDDPVGFLISDREFHVTIYKSCGNEALADFVSELYAYMLENRRKVVAKAGAIQDSYTDHAAILAALRQRDPEAVVNAFNAHLERIYTTTQLEMNSDPVNGSAIRHRRL